MSGECDECNNHCLECTCSPDKECNTLRECKKCSELFMPNRPYSKYCSKECRKYVPVADKRKERRTTAQKANESWLKEKSAKQVNRDFVNR